MSVVNFFIVVIGMLLMLSSCQESFCENSQCFNGFICDEQLEDCVCPEETHFISHSRCSERQANMYFPVISESDSMCYCHNMLTSIVFDFETDTLSDLYALKIAVDWNDSNSSSTPRQLGLHENSTDSFSHYRYYLGFMGDELSHLPCEFEGKRVNGHLYVNVSYQEIEWLVQFFEWLPVSPLDDRNRLFDCKFTFERWQ